MNYINLTPHAITVRVGEDDRTVAPSGQLARVAQTTSFIEEVDGIPVFRSTFGDVTGLPEQEEGTTLIVSALVLGALAGTRNDVVAPRTDATAIRNEQGHIVAVTGWLR